MKSPRLSHWLTGFALAIVLPLPAEIASEPAGFHKLTLLGNSDTIVSMPFSRPAVAIGTIDVAVSNVVQAQGSPAWTTNQFVYASGTQSNTYYVRFDSGSLEGRHFLITSNDLRTITLNLNGVSLMNVAQGDRFSVVPSWTLGTVFPRGKGIFASTSILELKGQVLVPNYTGNGINLSAGATYYFLTNVVTGAAAWRLIGSTSTNRDDDVLHQNIYLIIRNLVPTNSTFTSLGSVVLTKIAVRLNVSSTNQQDNILALGRPYTVSLDDSGLITSGAFTPTTSILSLEDQLIAFDNRTTNFNKSAAATYYYLNSAWRKVGLSSSINVGSSNVFVPGTGFIIRKSSSTNAPFWLNSATF